MFLRFTWLWRLDGELGVLPGDGVTVRLSFWNCDGSCMEETVTTVCGKEESGLKMCGTIFFIEGVCEGGYEHLYMRFPPPSGILVLGGHIRWHHPSLETWVWGVCVTHMTIVRIDL